MLINDQAQFDHWLSQFDPELYVGIDTEFVRHNTFFPTLALIQISSLKETAVIDPLSVNIEALLLKLQSTSILKIFFSGRQDLEAIFHAYGILLHPVFDLQIACDFLNYREHVSFGELVKETCYVTINKEMQAIDWSVRPLLEEAINYAYNDAFYLIPMFKVLKRKLKLNKRYPWVWEESSRLLAQVADQGEMYFEKWFFDPASPKNALHKEMVLWREYYARFKNISRQRIYTNATIHETKDLPWKAIFEQEFYFQLKPHDKLQFRKKTMQLSKIAKKHGIPKRYLDFPCELVKWITRPKESNIFLESWRFEILKDEKLFPNKKRLAPLVHKTIL